MGWYRLISSKILCIMYEANVLPFRQNYSFFFHTNKSFKSRWRVKLWPSYMTSVQNLLNWGRIWSLCPPVHSSLLSSACSTTLFFLSLAAIILPSVPLFSLTLLLFHSPGARRVPRALASRCDPTELQWLWCWAQLVEVRTDATDMSCKLISL